MHFCVFLIYRFVQRQYIGRLLAEPSEMSFPTDTKCLYCNEPHSDYNGCVVLCDYCKALHVSTDLVEGWCPRMTANNHHQPSQNILCEYCTDGEEESMIKIREMMKWLNITEGQGSSSVHVFDCAQCNGAKKLPILVECCKEGCWRCGFLKIVVNPAVKGLHMRAQQSSVEQECSICLQNISKGEAILRMQCNHEFHYLCLGEWLKPDRRRCPYCRHTDLFVEIDQDFIQQLREARLEQGEAEPELKVYINSDGEIVEGDQESEVQDDFEDMEFYDDEIFEQAGSLIPE